MDKNCIRMREFFELINEYPWTTFFIACFTAMILDILTCKK